MNPSTPSPRALALWAAAQRELYDGMPSLPSEFPEKDWLIAPRSEKELQAWMTLEFSRRKKLNAAVSEWLAHRQWPANLDAADKYLLIVRLKAAIDWVRLACFVTISPVDMTDLLSSLLIKGWCEAFLEQHGEKLQLGILPHQAGGAG